MLLDAHTAAEQLKPTAPLAMLLDHFDLIVQTPADVDKLDAAILQLAVEGKLVAQDTKEGSALAILDHLGKGSRSQKSGRASKRPSETKNAVDVSQPHEIPSNWVWAPFSEVAEFSIGKTPSTKEPQFWDDSGLPWVSIGDMPHYGTVINTARKVSELAASKLLKGRMAPRGTLLMSFKLTVGKVAFLDVDAFYNEAIIGIYPIEGVSKHYLFYFMPLFAQYGETNAAIKGATLNSQSLSSLPIPLPPLAEQKRIVAKVDELLALCDVLEAELAEAEAVRVRLVDAVLAGV